MFKIPLPEIKEKIVATGKITQEDLDSKIKAKINELSGLISEQGAAHIIANDLGISLMPKQAEVLKIKNLYAGMRNISCVGKVTRVWELREFQKGENKGKVQSIILGDETGTVRVVFWNDQVNQINGLQENDHLSIKNAYVKENQNNKEIHLADKASLEINPQGVEITTIRQTSSFQRKNIDSLSHDDTGVELMGTLVQIFDPRFFFQCPTCNKRTMEQQGKFNCEEHGEVKANMNLVMNAVLDDGTGTIRCVFWKNQAYHLTGKADVEFSAFHENPHSFEEVKTDLLGEQFKLMGKVKHNEMFDRLEFSAQLVEKAKAAEEIERLEAQKEAKPEAVQETPTQQPVPSPEPDTSKEEPNPQETPTELAPESLQEKSLEEQPESAPETKETPQEETNQTDQVEDKDPDKVE